MSTQNVVNNLQCELLSDQTVIMDMDSQESEGLPCLSGEPNVDVVQVDVIPIAGANGEIMAYFLLGKYDKNATIFKKQLHFYGIF